MQALPVVGAVAVILTRPNTESNRSGHIATARLFGTLVEPYRSAGSTRFAVWSGQRVPPTRRAKASKWLPERAEPSVPATTCRCRSRDSEWSTSGRQNTHRVRNLRARPKPRDVCLELVLH